MKSSTDSSCCAVDFEIRYEHHAHPAMRALEKEVLGCDFGGTSWTTRDQAEQIPLTLGLKPGVRLLEIGAGTGWPGVYMSSISGCDVTLLDLPFGALQQARDRANEEGLASLTRAISASGESLPFVDASFDVIAHSDVLCCLPGKLDMLRECRRVVHEGSSMLFFVIAPAEGLGQGDLTQVLQTGPPFVGVPDSYPCLLKQSCWETIQIEDITASYRDAVQRLVSGLENRADELRSVIGHEEFRNQITHRNEQIEAIENGLMIRELYLVRAV